MSDKTDSNHEAARRPDPGAVMAVPDLEGWFVREVLPLEAALMQFLRRSWQNKAEVDDLRQEVYVRVCEAARRKIPHPAKPFVFAVARNLLVDRVRREHVVSIETVSDIDTLRRRPRRAGPRSQCYGAPGATSLTKRAGSIAATLPRGCAIAQNRRTFLSRNRTAHGHR